MSFNQATIIGNIGSEVELKYTQSGTAICKLSVATSEKRKGEEFTTWHRVTVFGTLAEICGEYLNKGSKVFIQGRIHNDSYDKDGVKHYTSEIVADQMRMLDGKREGGERSQRTERPQRQAPTQQAPADDFEDSEIPF